LRIVAVGGPDAFETQRTLPRQVDVNGGNRLSPASIEKPLPVLFEAGLNLETSF
jgi:hypothetical protein